MPIKIGSTELSHINVNSDGVGLVLVNNVPIFADFDNGANKNVIELQRTDFFDDVSGSFVNPTEVYSFDNVYDVNFKCNNFSHSTQSYQYARILIYLYPVQNDKYAHFEFVYDSRTSSSYDETYSVIVYDIEGTQRRSDIYRGDSSISNKQMGLRITNDFDLQWYVGSTYGSIKPPDYNLSFLNGNPRVVIKAGKTEYFKDDCNVTFNIKQYQTVNNT